MEKNKYEVVLKFPKEMYDVIKLCEFEYERSLIRCFEDHAKISAKDATSLRASLDAIIKALKIYETTKEIIRSKNESAKRTTTERN